ncbi:L-aspartate oxidase [Pantoea sp. Aalb]|uniref:L-aspartate oxidase n=1 Tax=Pantoea sp. Aalb TaxID=2576762 RepID=UPI00132C0D05|nr:L-aspartate oxidase [Pantoea sp. Aalb]MXP67240.1 L-aspartate oxidase [Pantoea sp. Aalb]
MLSLHNYSCDVLIVGSGAAGLSLALRLAPYYQIILLSKTKIQESSTLYAQGGIAAVFDENDSIDSHIEDTLIAGVGLCNRDVVTFIAQNARHCVQWLIDQGVNFDKELKSCGQIGYHLTREGGHSHRRILHSADTTGYTVQTTLVNHALHHSNIRIIEYSHAIDLILSKQLGISGHRRVMGAWIWNYTRKQIEICYARTVVLATGGASKVYQYTTNPDVVSGDGIAMAWRAGCRVANLEFNQFHPTCLYYPLNTQPLLLTEALRGEGAWLVRPDGVRFMADFDARAELAPRDIVARAIHHEMKRLEVNCMYLDISHQSKKFIINHFPILYKKLLNLGLDLTKQPIPISPAAHYTCGGVMVNYQGKTDVDNLYAIGEVSYTGLHGANRIASNSLLECLVYSWSAAHDIIQHIPKIDYININHTWKHYSGNVNTNEDLSINRYYNEIRLYMWRDMGVIRNTQQLELLRDQIMSIQEKINKYNINIHFSNKLLELRNLTQVSELMVRCALKRKESRGLHYTSDFPKMIQNSKPTILVPPNYLK